MIKFSLFSLSQLLGLGAFCLSLTGLGITPVYASTTSFTPAQRAEIVDIVRTALKNDPSILSDAITSLQNKALAQKNQAATVALAANAGSFGQSSTDIVLGNPQGTLSIVEFYDPRCPYCRKVLPDLDKLVASNTNIRLVEKIIPVLGANSLMDAQAILAAGQQHAYLAFQKALMSEPSAPSLERIRRVAKQVGLNADQLLTDMKSDQVKQMIDHNLELARSIDLEGTPTFIIDNHDIIPGAVSLEELKAAVSRAQKAK